MIRLALATGWSLHYIESLPITTYRELLAFDRYVEPIGREWEQTGTLAAVAVAPYVKHNPPKPQDFIPVLKPPMTGSEIAAELSKLGKHV
ncbi:MAG: hypothetical protein EBR82_85330 [Caulobacteraceae bacterium]|nr:hypothetical protein [Caulobacteraceae bacterium]